MNFDDWRPVRRNTARYLHDLEAFVEEFIPWTIRSGFEPAFEIMPASEEEIREAALRIARRMVTAVETTNARSWREAARRSLNGQRIYQALRTEMKSPVGERVNELIARNARLIRSLPEEIAQRAARYIAREQQRGKRSSASAQELEARLPEFARSRVSLIARTEVSKAETALTQARAERLGLPCYEWATSEDQRVRASHRALDKVLVAWSDPPSPEQLAGERSTLGHYHAGGAPNCRCVALPLISLDEVPWPHKVYEHGRIKWMNRGEFERWNSIPAAA
jgi:SPP1 gp7 family putative phage head morphogenesis protein